MVGHRHDSEDLPSRSRGVDDVLDLGGDREVGVVENRNGHVQEAGSRHRRDHEDDREDWQWREKSLAAPWRPWNHRGGFHGEKLLRKSRVVYSNSGHDLI